MISIVIYTVFQILGIESYRKISTRLILTITQAYGERKKEREPWFLWLPKIFGDSWVTKFNS